MRERRNVFHHIDFEKLAGGRKSSRLHSLALSSTLMTPVVWVLLVCSVIVTCLLGLIIGHNNHLLLLRSPAILPPPPAFWLYFGLCFLIWFLSTFRLVLLVDLPSIGFHCFSWVFGFAKGLPCLLCAWVLSLPFTVSPT